MTVFHRLVLVLVLGAATAYGEEYLRVDSPSDGRSYTIDTDQTAVRRNLKPVTKSTAASKLPSWLYPGHGFEPFDLTYDPGTGIAQANFRCGGAEADIVAFYSQTLRARGLRVSTVQIQNNRGIHISGSNDSVAVGVRVERQAAAILVHVTYTPRQAAQGQHFEAVWYDDRIGILRLRDTATGDEYEMTKLAVQENNLNRVGGIEAEEATMPDWLMVYPHAVASPPGRITWMFTPTAEFTTTASIRQVYDYYKAALETAGATITSSNFTKSGTPSRDFSAKLVAQKGEDQVEIHIGELVQASPALLTVKKLGHQTGIGIRYTVPLR
jgi:hypothetical protein